MQIRMAERLGQLGPVAGSPVGGRVGGSPGAYGSVGVVGGAPSPVQVSNFRFDTDDFLYPGYYPYSYSSNRRYRCYYRDNPPTYDSEIVCYPVRHYPVTFGYRGFGM